MVFYRKLNLSYDPLIFKEIIEFAHDTDEWKDGYDQNGLQWNVSELDVIEDEFPILEEIFKD